MEYLLIINLFYLNLIENQLITTQIFKRGVLLIIVQQLLNIPSLFFDINNLDNIKINALSYNSINLNSSLHDLLLMSDLAIVFGSTVALDNRSYWEIAPAHLRLKHVKADLSVVTMGMRVTDNDEF